jgi:hypothetical protein
MPGLILTEGAYHEATLGTLLGHVGDVVDIFIFALTQQRNINKSTTSLKMKTAPFYLV